MITIIHRFYLDQRELKERADKPLKERIIIVQACAEDLP